MDQDGAQSKRLALSQVVIWRDYLATYRKEGVLGYISSPHRKHNAQADSTACRRKVNPMPPKAVCSECDTPIDEDPGTPLAQRSPCPTCGSTNRKFNVHVQDSATTHEGLSLKGRHGLTGKPFVEVKTGDDLFRKTGEWRKLDRRIDREKDEYSEKIVDPQTGRTIREVHERLSDHRGHGSAKRTKKRKGS